MSEIFASEVHVADAKENWLVDTNIFRAHGVWPQFPLSNQRQNEINQVKQILSAWAEYEPLEIVKEFCELFSQSETKAQCVLDIFFLLKYKCLYYLKQVGKSHVVSEKFQLYSNDDPII